MRCHFCVLVAGSLIFLVLFIRETWEKVTWSSAPGYAEGANTSHLLSAMQLLGVYCVFAVLVLGHGLLRRPVPTVDRGDETE